MWELLDIDRGCVEPNLQCGRRLMWEGRKDLRRKTELVSSEENEITRKEAGGSGLGRKKNQAPNHLDPVSIRAGLTWT